MYVLQVCGLCDNICLCVLLSGESGLGKSTLINSLFLTDLYPERVIPGAAGESFNRKRVGMMLSCTEGLWAGL